MKEDRGEKKENNKGGKELYRQLGFLSTLGITLVAATFVGFAIGYYLDKWLSTKPILMIIFTIFGVAAGFKNLFGLIKNKK